MPNKNRILILIWINPLSTCNEDRGEEEEEGGEGVGLQQEVLCHSAHRGELLQVAQQPQDHDDICKHKQSLLEKVLTNHIRVGVLWFGWMMSSP